jgi:predicted transcriptional regulator
MNTKTMDEIVDEYIDDVIKRNPSFMKKITRLAEKQWL